MSTQTGHVSEVASTIVKVNGLTQVYVGDVVHFETGEVGQVMNLNEESVDCLVFSAKPIKPGTQVSSTTGQLTIGVSKTLLGKQISPLGDLLQNDIYTFDEKREIFQVPLGISSRKKIHRAFFTGVKVVDLLLPLGHGQRELVIGDRKTGKTNFLLQTILFQVQEGAVCVYAAIGKRKSDIAKVEAFLHKHHIQNKCVIVASSPDDPLGTIHLTPYTAMTIAEYFKDQGRDVVLILDDLSTHAKFYREISLLSNRFPGRNSYPGDIFSIHAKLLERAGNFITDKGEYSITCLPVVETLQADLSGYIQTNIMSMTDGHLFFDSDLFSQGRRPAINPFLSVTRVGKQTQDSLQKEITNTLLTFLTTYEKMQNFTHFGAELKEEAQKIIRKGNGILSFLNQSPQEIVDQYLTLFLFVVLWKKDFDSEEEIKKKITDIEERYRTNAQFQEKVYLLVNEAESIDQLFDEVVKDSVLQKLI